jgi:hypothetical protein
MIERRDGTPRLFWHSGGAGGYSGIAGRFLKEGIVLVLLCNAGEGGDVQMLSRQVFSMLVPSDNDLLSQ